MNKQELVKSMRKLFMRLSQLRKFERSETTRRTAEPVVPPFVADYIKYAIENDWDLQDLFKV